jgi:hypothetical protein
MCLQSRLAGSKWSIFEHRVIPFPTTEPARRVCPLIPYRVQAGAFGGLSKGRRRVLAPLPSLPYSKYTNAGEEYNVPMKTVIREQRKIGSPHFRGRKMGAPFGYASRSKEGIRCINAPHPKSLDMRSSYIFWNNEVLLMFT